MRQWTLDNPVVTKEFRSRMRGSRAYWLLFSYLLLLSLTLFFAYLAWWNSHQNGMDYGGGGQAGFTVGRTFFLTLFYAQAILVTLITPALTAGAISIEREQRTFEMLRSTTLPPRAIALGKLASSVSFIVLLLTSSLPLVSLCFLLGGVSPGEVFFGYLLLVCDAFVLGAIGLAWSAYAANTATATALSYGSIFLWFALTFPFAVPGINNYPGIGLAALNPIGAVTGAVTQEHYYGWTLAAWIPALLVNGALGTLLVLACINRLEDYPARRAWGMRLAALAFCGLLLLFGNGIIFSPMAGGMPDAIQIGFLTTAALAAVILFVPVFVTGDLTEWPPRRHTLAAFFSGWTPRRAFGDAALPSALPFALLLTALIAGLMFAALHLSVGQRVVMPFGIGMRGAMPLWARGLGTVTPLIWQAAGLLASVVVGLAGAGFLLSVLLGNRWAALTLLYLLMVLGMALPFFSYGTLSVHDAALAARSPAINTLYLCPWLGLWQSAYSLALQRPHSVYETFEGNFPVVQRLAGYGDNTVWVTSALLYLLLGVVCYAIGLAVVGWKRT
ncbi:MAG: hypothetical protein JO250_21990 [Armatimonadetes bacterium]|nr:hypothetical protein [Armatimonadota bacterium]